MAAELAAPLTRGRGTYRDYVRMQFGPNVATLKETKTSSAITYRLTPLGAPPPISSWIHMRTCCAKQAVHRGVYLIIADSALGAIIRTGGGMVKLNWIRMRTCCPKQALHRGAYSTITDSTLGAVVLTGTYADELPAAPLRISNRSRNLARPRRQRCVFGIF